MRQRMAEIRAQLGAAAPKPSATALSGYACLTGTLGGSTNPANPFGDGMAIAGKVAPADLKAKMVAAAQANGVDPDLLDALVQAESSYDPNSVSKVGAKGLTQLMPETAASVGVQNPFDPDQSLRGGAKYLASLLKQFPDVSHAVAAYNAGPGAVIRAGGIPNYPETRAYVQRVMALYRGNKS